MPTIIWKNSDPLTQRTYRVVAADGTLFVERRKDQPDVMGQWGWVPEEDPLLAARMFASALYYGQSGSD